MDNERKRIDPSKRPNWVKVLPDLPVNFRFRNTSEPPTPSRRGVPPRFSPRQPQQPAQVDTSFGQQPTCDSECLNCQTEPEARPSRGQKSPVPPKPPFLNVQPQAAIGGFDYNRGLGEPPKVKKIPPPVAPKPKRPFQPASQPTNIFLPPVPPQPGMMRPQFPQQPGMMRPPFPQQPGMMRPPFPQQPGMMRPPFPQQPGMLRPTIPTQPGMFRPSGPQQDVHSPPAPSSPLSLRSPTSPRADAQQQATPYSDGFHKAFVPHTPPSQEEQYEEYMMSRGHSQGRGEISVMEPPDMRRRIPSYRPTLEPMSPPTDLYTKYSRRLTLASSPLEQSCLSPTPEPKHRTRLYGTSESISMQEPHQRYTGPFFPDTPNDEKEYNEQYKEYKEYVRTHPPFSPHSPPRGDEEYMEYMRSRPPSQADGEISFQEAAAAPAKRKKKAYGLASRRVIAIPPPGGPIVDIAPISPDTPPRQEEGYTEYMRMRAPSQGDGQVKYPDPANVPLPRRRLFGMAGIRGSKPFIAPQSDDNVFRTNRIHNVTSQNFDEITKSMEKAFVMFYDPKSENSICAGKEFAKAADKKHPDNHGFAVVDCTKEQELCAREDATRLPIFKLYSNGFDLSTVRNAKQFCAKQIQQLMKMTPVLTQPRAQVDPGLQGR